MSAAFLTGIYLSLITNNLLNCEATTLTCSEATTSTGPDCLDEYGELLNPVPFEDKEPYLKKIQTFMEYLETNDQAQEDTNWYTFWENEDNQNIDYCIAILPIMDTIPSSSCLCELQNVCDTKCDIDIKDAFFDVTFVIIVDNTIPDDIEDRAQKCSTVLNNISPLSELCGDTEIYQSIQQCASGDVSESPTKSPNPTQSTTASPTQPPSTPSPTKTPSDTKPDATPEPTTKAPSISQSLSPTNAPSDTVIASTADESNDSSEQQNATNSNVPTIAPSLSPEPTTKSFSNITTAEPTIQRFNESTTTTKWPSYEPTYRSNGSILDSLDDIPSTTNSTLFASNLQTNPFPNLLLVSLIILGFCVFVAWYAKKNQIENGDERRNGVNDDDNGYLWGLNKPDASSPSSEDRMMTTTRKKKQHKKKFNRRRMGHGHDDDDEDEEMGGIQMSNHDLLTITPDHVGNLQTRSSPNEIAPNIPKRMKHKNKHKNKNKMKTKRRGKGGKFERLQDDNDDGFSGSDEESDSDSDSGVDMMKMRDEYHASQTFSKKLVDTLGDIHDTVKETANAVKSKLIKKEKTVVVPMAMGGRQQNGTNDEKKSSKTKKTKQPFTMVEDNETTDGFDLSPDDESSPSTQDNEYREDSETDMRTNIHGRKIKQPMKLPTFEDDDDDLNNSHAHKKHHKRKKKKKKRKKDKKNKNNIQEKVEVIKQEKETEIIIKETKNENENESQSQSQSHDIDIKINNDEYMGFGTDELNDDDMNMNNNNNNNQELTHEDVTMTMQELEMELQQSQKKNDDNDNNEDDGDNHINMDLSNSTQSINGTFIDVIDTAKTNNNDNQVLGNGNVQHQTENV